jgi:hypothetical protein
VGSGQRRRRQRPIELLKRCSFSCILFSYWFCLEEIRELDGRLGDVIGWQCGPLSRFDGSLLGAKQYDALWNNDMHMLATYLLGKAYSTSWGPENFGKSKRKVSETESSAGSGVAQLSTSQRKKKNEAATPTASNGLAVVSTGRRVGLRLRCWPMQLHKIPPGSRYADRDALMPNVVD